MTRKACSNLHVDDVLQSVCCDFYYDYTRLRCRNRPEQPRYLRRSSRFFHLEDLCCNADKSAFQLFLKINGITLNKPTKSASLMTRNKMPKTRTSTMYDKIKNSPLSPTGSDSSGHWLRARRTTNFNSSYLDNSGDDDSNQAKPVRELRSTTKLLLKSLEQQPQDTWESGRPKRTCIKNKRISADERLVVDNKTYYKVEVMTNKLRSSGATHREVEVARKTKNHQLLEEIDDDKTKYPKLRNSELTRLNNEAENFLFPHKCSLSSDDEVNGDNSNLKCNNKKTGNDNKVNKTTSTVVTNSKHVHDEETSMDSTSSETSSSHKKKRLTQAEAFILDNQRYYKFETPGSRLRYQGSYLAPVPNNTKNNGEYSSKHVKQEVIEKKKSNIDLDKLKFSFELIPEHESWYETFQRQDKGEESYVTYNEPGFYKPFLLPYEMGPLPPLDPRICVYNYVQLKKRFLNENGAAVASTSAAASKSESSSSAVLSSGDSKTNITDSASPSKEESKAEPEKTNSETVTTRKVKHLPKQHQHSTRKGTIFVPTKNPRKSPRQHASTLAILSSLIQQRKRRDLHKSKHADVHSSKHNLSTISEDDKEPEEIDEDYETVAKSISEMLTDSMGQLEQLDIEPSDCINVDVHCEPNAVDSLQDYINLENEPPSVSPNAKTKTISENPIRKPYRKKKKNRTGWPNKNKRTVFRKEGSNSRDGLGGSENSNSVVNSPCVAVDSEEGEEGTEDLCNNKSSLTQLAGDTDEGSNPSITEENNENKEKVNGDVQGNKLNGISENFELNFKNLSTPKRKEHRESSSDNCAEVVIASVGDKIDCVNVDLAKWENAERVLTARLRSESMNNDIQFQPIVRVQKIDSSDISVKRVEKRTHTSPSPKRTRPRRSMPASPKSPRMLRRPRGGWYRERYY